jgi:hypothetical protein
MVADLRTNRAEARARLLAAIRVGLESLTVTGPSIVLESMYRDALMSVMRRPTTQEREAALSRAWQASAKAMQHLQVGNPPEATQAVEEMYSQIRLAISASRP